mmetsp:Transcript_79404/g.227856  ORF Transcript_79404/g.227856 Transcript_79404/m.227856 type:complete len:246 (+) Transcript_79404:804-1541(+)
MHSHLLDVVLPLLLRLLGVPHFLVTELLLRGLALLLALKLVDHVLDETLDLGEGLGSACASMTEGCRDSGCELGQRHGAGPLRQGPQPVHDGTLRLSRTRGLAPAPVLLHLADLHEARRRACRAVLHRLLGRGKGLQLRGPFPLLLCEVGGAVHAIALHVLQELFVGREVLVASLERLRGRGIDLVGACHVRLCVLQVLLLGSDLGRERLRKALEVQPLVLLLGPRIDLGLLGLVLHALDRIQYA